MINKRIERIISKEKGEGNFIYPFYEKYCFSNIPSTILSFFGIKTKRPTLPSELYEEKIEGSNKVVLFLIDALGYNQWIRYNNEFFRTFTQKGLVSPITTIFPSTTAATITTISSGLTPQEHGLPEWNVYFKEIDMIIDTLPFRPLGDKNRDSLLEKKVNPKILFDSRTIYQKLKNSRIKSFVFKNKSYAESVYSKLIDKGSEVISFINISDLAVNLRKRLEKEKGPAYIFIYYDCVDSMQHEYGPYTEEHGAELSTFSYALKRELLGKIKKRVAKETIFIITADHGQLNIPPKKTLYLNKYKKLVNSFQESNGKPILPTGSPRDVFLYVKPEKLEEIQDYLSNLLKGKAKVMKSEDALKMGLFGIGKVHKDFIDRIGNLLILPYSESLIWYEHIKGKKVKLIGHHGGLSKEEMLIPFSVAKLSDLI